MKYGFQTIIFGSRINDLEAVLETVAACGFQGIEFSQPPDRIQIQAGRSRKPVTALVLGRLLEKYHLQLLGLAGAPLPQRMDFCNGKGKGNKGWIRPRYLYVDQCDEEMLLNAASDKFRLALHPHVYMANHTLDEASDLLDILNCPGPCREELSPNDLREYGRLYWMPDTAHLFVSGQSIERAINLVPTDRIAAIHLKDWDSAYGRSYHRYAKGFTELGQGDVKPEHVLELLKGISYDGWVVVEQDYTVTDAVSSAFDNAQWLGLEPGKRNKDPKPIPAWDSPELRPQLESLAIPAQQLTRSLMDIVGENLDQSYKGIARSLWELGGCHAVAIWSYIPDRDEMCRLAAEGKVEKLPTTISKQNQFGSELDKLSITEIDWKAPEGQSQKKPERAILVPVLNRFNHHQIRLVVTLHLSDPIKRKSKKSILSDVEWFANDLLRIIDASLDDLCNYAAGRVHVLAACCRDLDSFLEAIGIEIRRFVECEGLTIFIVNEPQDRLESRYSTGIKWYTKEGEEYYIHDKDTYTGQAWVRNEPILTRSVQADHKRRFERHGYEPPPYKPRSEEIGEEVDPGRDSILLVPLVSASGKVIGVVRCRNRSTKKSLESDKQSKPDLGRVTHSKPEMEFTHDDAAIVDAIGRAAVPQIEVLINDLHRARSLAKLTHELYRPVGAIRGALDLMISDLDGSQLDRSSIFHFDYPSHMVMWADLIVRLVDNVDLYSATEEDLVLEPEPTNIRDDVVAPAVMQIHPLLQRRGFDYAKITYEDFDKVPMLNLDKARFQQVIFNLLSNSIKFAYREPAKFAIEIKGNAGEDYYELIVRDKGQGITEEYSKSIFEEGRRGPSVQGVKIQGQGFGLAVVRRIAEAHGGYAKVTQLCEPTEITVYLPKSLKI